MYIVKNKRKYKTIKLSDQDIVVQPKAVTMSPQQCLDLSKQGIPISSQMANAEYFQDGEQNPGDFVSMDRRRGFDINDAWNEEMRIKKQVNGIIKEARKKKGDQDANT